jgi:hypothetical protein
MNVQETAIYREGKADARKQLAEDLTILKENCIHNEIDKKFIAGLDTAIELATGAILLHPAVYEDPNQPPLFEDEDF